MSYSVYQDTTVQGGTPFLWPIWLRAAVPGNVSLYIVIYYEMEGVPDVMNFRTLRLQYNVQVCFECIFCKSFQFPYFHSESLSENLCLALYEIPINLLLDRNLSLENHKLSRKSLNSFKEKNSMIRVCDYQMMILDSGKSICQKNMLIIKFYQVLPSMEVSYKISPCPLRLHEFLVRMDILNRTSLERFCVHQLSCIGNHWEISLLHSNDTAYLSENLLGGQSMSCFFKLKVCDILLLLIMYAKTIDCKGNQLEIVQVTLCMKLFCFHLLECGNFLVRRQ